MTEQTAQPDFNEIASTRDGRDITRGYVDSMPLLQSQDGILQAKGYGDYQIYDQILSDDQVKSVFSQRQAAVISRELEVIPGGKKRIDKKAADFMKELVTEGINFDAATDKMLYGVFYGYAVGEPLWMRDGAYVSIDQIKVRDRSRFGFRPNGRLVLKTTRNPNGEELPDRKFWVYATGATHDDEPYGLGLAHWFYWAVLFKRNGIRFWLLFLEKFGGPTAVGKFPGSSTPEEQKKLLQAVEAIQMDSGIIIPDTMLVELLEASRGGNAGYERLYDRMNASISKVGVGQTMTTDDGSSQSQANIHMDVRQDIVKADSDLVNGSWNLGPGRWLTEWNFPGAEPPRVSRRIEDEPDLLPQAERDKVIFDMGFKPSLSYVNETYGGEWEEKETQPAPENKSGVGRISKASSADQTDGAPPAEEKENQTTDLAEPEEQHPENVLADRLAIEAIDPLSGWKAKLHAIITVAAKEGLTLEQLRDRLISSYGDLPTEDLAKVMQIGFAAAELSGRYDVAVESDLVKD